VISDILPVDERYTHKIGLSRTTALFALSFTFPFDHFFFLLHGQWMFQFKFRVAVDSSILKRAATFSSGDRFDLLVCSRRATGLCAMVCSFDG
jgi:hypothetical protein